MNCKFLKETHCLFLSEMDVFYIEISNKKVLRTWGSFYMPNFLDALTLEIKIFT
jgi:hypothetical protein